MGMMERIDSSTDGAKEFLSFRLGGEEYGMDIMGVREIRGYEKPTRMAGAPDYIRGVINLRGAIVPIMDLRKRFGLAESTCQELTVVIILDVAGRLVGIVVDSVSDVLALQASQVRPTPEMASPIGARIIRGIATVSERLLILLDIEALVSSQEPVHLDAAMAEG